MNKKIAFLNYIEKLLNTHQLTVEDMPEDARLYYEALKAHDEVEKPMFTENGKLVLQYMKDNQQEPLFKAKVIAEGLFVSSRTVSGAMRKLVTDGYVEKVGQDPVIYKLTEKGQQIEIV